MPSFPYSDTQEALYRRNRAQNVLNENIAKEKFKDNALKIIGILALGGALGGIATGIYFGVTGSHHNNHGSSSEIGAMSTNHSGSHNMLLDSHVMFAVVMSIAALAIVMAAVMLAKSYFSNTKSTYITNGGNTSDGREMGPLNKPKTQH